MPSLGHEPLPMHSRPSRTAHEFSVRICTL